MDALRRRATVLAALAALLACGWAPGPAAAQETPENARPLAVFFLVPSVAQPGDVVELNATDSRDPDGNLTRYEWDFEGTGAWEEGPPVVRRTYNTSGAYTVRLRVTDDRNATATAAWQLLVATERPLLNVPVVLRTLPFWAQGALLTLWLAFAALALALPLAVVLGLARSSARRLVRAPASAYVEAFRGTPLLVQILIAWLVLPHLGLRLAPIDAGLLALTLNTAAYMAEVVRAGIEAVPAGQLEAALSLGFRRLEAMRHVVLPQAFRMTVPPLTNEFAILLKDTSLVSVIGVVELTQVTRIVSAQTFAVLELWLGVAAIYFVLIYPVTVLSRRLERALHVPGLGVGG